MKVEIIILDERVHEVGVPDYATSGSAGMDLRSLEDVSLGAGGSHQFKLGWKMNMGSHQMCGLLAPRSSLGVRGIHLSNIVGIIDSDYQGELIVSLTNNSSHPEPYVIQVGERIAQLVFMPVEFVSWSPVAEFSYHTTRGEGGFGSTGKK